MWPRGRVTLKLLLSITFLFCSPIAWCRVLYYPAPESQQDLRHVYPLKLLDLAFSKVGYQVDLLPNQRVLPQARALLYLSKELNMDVVWTMTSSAREKEYLPIRIPIYKGLIGWRIPLVKNSLVDGFSDIDSLEKLGKKDVLQGSDWPDRLILEASGIPVQHTHYYANMFNMLARERADLFLRSVVEIWDEFESNRGLGLVVEPSLIVRYPTAYYFFVHKDNVQLADIIRQGLFKSIEDGSFEKVFQHHLKKHLVMSKIDERRVIYLDNPLLPRETPLEDKRLWFN